MITLESVTPLFDQTTPFSKADFVPPVLSHMKRGVLAGVSDSDLEVSGQEDGSDGIMVKRVDPHAATGYLAFQSVEDYNGWLTASLIEPTQDEVEEAANRGNGT